MITTERFTEALDFVREQWGDKVVHKAAMANKTYMPLNDYLRDHCYACGGNWGGMLLTGVKKLYPEVWDAIPDDMGIFAFTVICNLLTLLGIDTEEEEKDEKTS